LSVGSSSTTEEFTTAAVSYSRTPPESLLVLTFRPHAIEPFELAESHPPLSCPSIPSKRLRTFRFCRFRLRSEQSSLFREETPQRVSRTAQVDPQSED